MKTITANELQKKIDAGEPITCLSIKYISDGCHEQCMWLGTEEPQIGQKIFVDSAIMPDYGTVEEIYQSIINENYENEGGDSVFIAEPVEEAFELI